MVDHPSLRPVPDPGAKPAVETTKIELNGNEWHDLGPGPLLIGVRKGDNVVYSIGDHLPRHSVRDGFPLLVGAATEIHTWSHIWAMSKDHHSGVVFAVPI